MAQLKSLRQNVSRVTEGDWIDVGFDDADQFRIRTRGQTPKYLYRLNELQRAASAEANRGLSPGMPPFRPDDLPTPLANRCLGQAMADETFLDVDGLDEDGAKVTAEQFRAFLRQPAEYSALIFLAYGAMLKIHGEKQEEARAAVGNSETASAGV